MKEPGNKASERGEYKGHGKHEKETVHQDLYCGSSDSHGIRFKVHNMPDKSDLHTPEKE